MFWITVLFVVFMTVIFLIILGTVFGAPWVPTSKNIIRKMLAIADIKSGDIVYDLGSGDGRIIVMAAREFQAASIGIEINPFWVVWTKIKIALFQLGNKVNVIWGTFSIKI